MGLVAALVVACDSGHVLLCLGRREALNPSHEGCGLHASKRSSRDTVVEYLNAAALAHEELEAQVVLIHGVASWVLLVAAATPDAQVQQRQATAGPTVAACESGSGANCTERHKQSTANDPAPATAHLFGLPQMGQTRFGSGASVGDWSI
jgi:hypothetical protein